MQSVELLNGLESFWGITPANLSGLSSEDEKQDKLITNLYQRMQNRSLWERAFGKLSEEERNLVNFLAIHGGDLAHYEVTMRFFENDKARLIKLVEGLTNRGIVFFDQVPDISEDLSLVGIPEPFLRYIDLPSFWEGYLGNFLKEKSNNELKHVATQGLRVHPESACKNYLIWQLRKNLLDPKFLRNYLDRLPPGCKQVLDLLMERKGVCVYRDLLELNVQKRYDHSRGDAINWLLNTSGLLYVAVPGGNKYNSLLMVPRDIAYILNNHFKPDTRTFKELDLVTLIQKQDTPTVIMDNSNTLLRDMVVFCNFVHRNPVKMLATGGIGKNDLKKVLPQLSRFKSIKYAEFLSLFAIQKKFLVSTGDSYRVSNTFLQWLEHSQSAYCDVLFWWLKSTEWNEEFIDGNTVHVEPRPTGLTSIVSFRRCIIDVLNEMPRDRWCLFNGFLEEALPSIRQEIPNRNDPLAYDKNTRSNELVIESVLAECLQWLGLVAIGLRSDKDAEVIGMRRGDGKLMKARGGSRGRPRKQPDIEFTFRFTDLGRFVFESHPEHWGTIFENQNEDLFAPLKYQESFFIVQPTHEVIVPPDLNLRTFYHLNEMAAIKSIDVMSIMSIARESIREGLDHGLRGEEMLEFLSKNSRTPIPDSINQLIKDCADKHGEVNMGFAGGYIVIDDEILLEQMKANKKISPAIKDIIDNRLVLLNADIDVRKLARELQRVGFMPRLGSEHIYMKDDDLFHLSLSREDMYTLIAAVRYTLQCKDSKGRSVAEERLRPLLEHLKPDPRTFTSLNDLAEPLLNTWLHASQAAIETQVGDLKEKYQTQISKIVNTTMPRGLSKHNFKGPNPATEEEDIERMLEFAVEHEFEVKIQYVKNNRAEVEEVVAPESIERGRLLGRCKSRDNAFAVYRIERIMEARLI
jgi:Helicase conserved C-terminal domain